MTVYLVYGPPYSGRTAYVKAHADSSDLVVNVRALAAALHPDCTRPIPGGVWQMARQIFELALRMIEDQMGEWNQVWIIGDYPKRVERQRVIQRLKAKAILMDVSKESCLSRAANAQPDPQLPARIRKWFEEFEPDRTDRTNWNREVHSFYLSSTWKKKREEVLALDHHECQMCKARGKYRRATVVHHVNHLEDRKDLALEIWHDGKRNLISVCADCHNQLHPEKGMGGEKKNLMNTERW